MTVELYILTLPLTLYFHRVSCSVSTWMGDRQGRPSAVNLCSFVGVDCNL